MLVEDNVTCAGKHFVSRAQLITYDSTIKYMTCRFEDNRNNRSLPELFPYFSHGHNLGANCDYIVFAHHNEAFYVLLFELKLYSPKNRPNVQLNISETFARFIVDRFNATGNVSPFEFHVRKIGVRDPQIAKMRAKQYTQAKDYAYDEHNYFEFCGDGKTTTMSIVLDALLK